MIRALHGFTLSFEISVVLHVLVVAMVLWIVHYHAPGLRIPPPVNPFTHAVAVSLAPPEQPPQPKPKVMPPEPHTPKPQPPAISTQAAESNDVVPPPARKPAPPEMPPPQEQDQAQTLPVYQQLTEGILEQNKRYPRIAVMAGDEGTVELEYIVNNKGTVLSFTILKSSGHEDLDDEVRRLIRSVRFPPFPAGDMDLRKTLDVTIEFTLSGGLEH